MKALGAAGEALRGEPKQGDANGGETKLDNLVLLCGVHHRLVHEEGFTVARDASGVLRFRTPDGRRIEDAATPRVLAGDPVLARLVANTQHGARITQRTCVPEWFGERPDYNWLVGCLQKWDERPASAVERSRRSIVRDVGMTRGVGVVPHPFTFCAARSRRVRSWQPSARSASRSCAPRCPTCG